MSLHARFILLLAVLGAAVIASIGAAIWSVGMLDREQGRPVEQIGSVLGVLNSTKRTLWEQAGEIGLFVRPGEEAPDAPIAEERVARFRELGRQALDRLAQLDTIDAALVRAGVTTANNLRRRIQGVTEKGEAIIRGEDPSARDNALSELYTLHEFIERLEARLIEEAHFSADHADQVRQRLAVTLAGAVISVVLALAAAGWLFRRWVLVRLDRLRVAAERIGAGDFTHRIEVRGSDELDRVASQVNGMTETIARMQAERIERERLAAVGNMARRLAHNIRNPLAGIRSLAELSSTELPGDSPVREHQSRIMRTVDQFNRWLHDFVSVSNPLSVEPSEHELAPWLAELVESHRPLADSRGVTLSIACARAPERVWFDRRHMEHVASALITNAIQASPKGGRVTITTQRENGTWGFCVADQGAGIKAEHFGSLFAPYFTTKPGGTGIGLAQAKRVVVEHEGRIWAENRVDREPETSGAVFWVELPIYPSGKMANIGQQEEANRGQGDTARG